MSQTLNYNIKFASNASKINAGVDRLDKQLHGVGRDAKKMSTRFGRAMDKMNSKLSTVAMDSFINNIQHASQGLKDLSGPGIELNANLQDLQAITGLAGEKLQQLEGFARDNAKTFGGSASESVESYKLLLSQLGPDIANTPKALRAMADNVSVLSKTMGGDATAATEVLTTAMNQYQVSLEDPTKASAKMSEMMNIMAAAAKAGSAELPAQKAALENAGLAAKTAKVQFAETAASIQILDKAGLKGSEGGRALKNVLATLSKGRFLPPDVQKELKAAGVDVSDLSDKSKSLAERLTPLKAIMEDQALVTKLFGRENSNAAIAMISGIEEQKRLTKAVQGTNTAMEQANSVMESQAEKNARLKARVDDFKISLFNATNGAMGYAAVLGDVAFSVSNLIPLLSGAFKAVTWLTKAKNLSVIASKAQLVWNGIVTGATYVWTAAQWALNAALNANPIGIIIGAIAALVGAITWVVSKTTGWGEAWQHTINAAKLYFKAFVSGVQLYFNTMVNGIMIGLNYIKLGWYKFKEAMGLGDSSENTKMIQKIHDDTEKRKKAILDGAKKTAKLTSEANEEMAKAFNAVKWKDGDEKEEVPAGQKPPGIKIPKVPGTDNNAQQKQPSGDDSGDEKTKTNKAIATGGQKNNYITINLKDLIGVLNIKGSDFKDSAKQMQDEASDGLLRVLALAGTSAG